MEEQAHFVVANNHRLEGIKPSGDHVTSRYISYKFRSFRGIDDGIAFSLSDRLVVGPLHQLFPTGIAKDEVILAAVAENKVHRLPQSIDKLKVSLERARIRESHELGDYFQPHLDSIVDRAGDGAERIGFLRLRHRGTGIVFLALPNKRHPPVNSAGTRTASECNEHPGEDRNTKIHRDDLADVEPGCKSYPISTKSAMGTLRQSLSSGAVLPSLLIASLGCNLHGQGLKIILPTENHALLEGNKAAFYQYVKRDFDGAVSEPREGGQYGFVRNPVRMGSTIIYTRFHEGVDIRPLRRDANGEPLDPVHAIAAGTVVYTNPVPSYSNYGRYIVVEHQFDGCPYYSLYAHLNAIEVKIGDHVSQNDVIGVLGHTGEGIDRERAHLHLELNLLLDGEFDRWSSKYFPADGNRHGIYNGQNLDGFDIGRLYLELAKNPSLTIPEFFKEETVWYKVLLPASKHMDLLRRYPWLSGGQLEAPAWEISFNQAGIPIRAQAADKPVLQPAVTWVKSSPYPYAPQTRGYLQGSGSSFSLSPAGRIDLISPEQEP